MFYLSKGTNTFLTLARSPYSPSLTGVSFQLAISQLHPNQLRYSRVVDYRTWRILCRPGRVRPLKNDIMPAVWNRHERCAPGSAGSPPPRSRDLKITAGSVDSPIRSTRASWRWRAIGDRSSLLRCCARGHCGVPSARGARRGARVGHVKST